MKRRVVTLLLAALVLGGCASSGKNEPPQRHFKPSSNQNPDMQAP